MMAEATIIRLLLNAKNLANWLSGQTSSARSPCLTHHPLCQRHGRIASVDSGLGLIRKYVGANVPELTQLFP